MDFGRYAEETSVDYLPNAITRAGKNYLRNLVLTQLPDWIRTISAIHDIRETTIEQ